MPLNQPKNISAEPLATSVKDTDQLVVNIDNGNGTYTTKRVPRSTALQAIGTAIQIAATGSYASADGALSLTNVGMNFAPVAGSGTLDTEQTDVNTNLSRTLTWPATSVLRQRASRKQPPTYAAQGAPAAQMTSAPAWSTDVPTGMPAGITSHSVAFTPQEHGGQRINKYGGSGFGYLGPTNNFCAALWIKPASGMPLDQLGIKAGNQSFGGGNPVIIVGALVCGSEIDAGFHLAQGTNGNYTLAACIDGGGGFFTGGVIPPGVWTHVAFKCDNAHSIAKLYVNGQVVATNTNTPSVFNDISIGFAVNGSNGSDPYGYTFGDTKIPYSGLMTDIRTWQNFSTLPTDADIATMAAFGTSLSSNPQTWLKCDDGTGTTLANAGTNAFPAFMSSTPTYSADIPAQLAGVSSLSFTDGGIASSNANNNGTNPPSTATVQLIELYGTDLFDGFGNAVPGGVPNWSFACWVKHTVTSGSQTHQTIFSDGYGGRPFGLALSSGSWYPSLYYNPTAASGQSDGAGGSEHLSTTAVAANAWHHVGVSVSNGTATFYVDGVAAGTAANVPQFYFETLGRANVFGNPFSGMGNPFAGHEGFNGLMADVRFYHSALTAGNFTSLAAGTDVAGAVTHLQLATQNGTQVANTGSTVIRFPFTDFIDGPPVAGANTVFGMAYTHGFMGQALFADGWVRIAGPSTFYGETRSSPLLQLGSGGFNGFGGNHGIAARSWNYSGDAATTFGINEIIGFSHPLADWQIGGASAFKIDNQGQATFGRTDNGQQIEFTTLTELTTIAAAATTATAIQIPANAVVLGVSVRVVTAIPTAATFTVTGTTSATVFNTAAVSTGAGSTDPGTKAGAFYNATAQTITFTPNQTPGAGTGQVRVTVHYYIITPPGS